MSQTTSSVGQGWVFFKSYKSTYKNYVDGIILDSNNKS